MKVFISHARNDSGLARAVAEELTKLGHTVRSVETITAGEETRPALQSALSECQAMIVILNPHSYYSPWVKLEVEHALSDESYKGRLLPVLVGRGFDSAPKRTPWILTALNHLALPNADEVQANARKVVRAFRKITSSQES